MSQGRTLVIGGTGFVGSYAKAALLSAGYHVASTSTSGRGADFALDFRDVDAAVDLLKAEACGVIVNCAVTYERSLREQLEVNVVGPARLATAVRDMPVHFVGLSSVSALPSNRHTSDYGFTKSLADEFLAHAAREGRWKLTVLRFPQIFDARGRSERSQPGLHRWLRQLRSGDTIEVFTKSTSKRSYISVDVVVAAIVRAVELSITGIHDVVPSETFTPLEIATHLAGFVGADQGQIQLNSAVAPAGYELAECSHAFADWLTRQEPVLDGLRRFANQGVPDGQST